MAPDVLKDILYDIKLVNNSARRCYTSCCRNKDAIDQPLKEIDLTCADVHYKSSKICITTFDGEYLKLKANDDAEAFRWTSKILKAIEGQANRMQISDGEIHVLKDGEEKDRKNFKDIPSREPDGIEAQTCGEGVQMNRSPPSTDVKEMIASTERRNMTKEIAKRRLSTRTANKMDKMIHEIEKLKPNSVEKSETPSKVSVPTRHAKQYVVAIDFGTTYSGYAYQHMGDHVRYPAGGYTQMWQGSNGLSEKTSTSLLLTKDGKFEAFGYEAETRYSELMENNEEEGWKFFKHFKMEIFQEKDLNRDFKIKDDQGMSMPAGIVFGLSIEFLKQRAFKHIKESDPNMMEENIFYVITVPAIWCENSRQFMRDAIRIAGIDDDQAILAKEPEVAAVYCKEKQLDVQQANKRISRQNHVFRFEQGSKFVVLDLGGGTTDVAVQEVIDDGRMKILRSASGGPWGGIKPDEEFMHIIKEVISMGKNAEFPKKNRLDYYELLQTWEFKKRVSPGEITSDINISLPLEIIENISIPKEEEIVTSKGNVRVLRGKLKLSFETFKSLFNETVRHIVDHLKHMAEEGSFEDANVMFMVGGFSSSRFIQEAVRDAFPGMTIIVPTSPVLAILLGAVAYGFQPNTIDARVSSSHYGIEENGRFVQLINKGQEIPIGVIVSTYKTRLVSGKDGFHLRIFSSENNIPPKAIGQCRSIGEIFIRMYRAHGKIEKDIEIAIYFDLTEMKVQATDVQTQRNFITSCNFLN